MQSHEIKDLKWLLLIIFVIYISAYIYGSVNCSVGKSKFILESTVCSIHEKICSSSWNKIKANPLSWFYTAIGFMQNCKIVNYTVYDYWFMKDRNVAACFVSQWRTDSHIIGNIIL